MLLAVAQLIIKSRLNTHGAIPVSGMEIFDYILAVSQDWRLVGGFLVLAVAAFGWYAGLSRVPLSIGFPIAALSYPLLYFGAVTFLREDFSWLGLVGNVVIVAGVMLASAAQ